MSYDDIVSILRRAGFERTDFHGTKNMGLTKSVNGKNYFYWFGTNTEGSLTMSKQGDNFVPIRADGIDKIEMLISHEFPKEYKEYKRDMKLKQLGI